MDDNRFDDIIKQKLEGYEGPSFDPSALSALHYQMAAQKSVPWYTHYQSELITGVLITLGTVIILLSQWYWYTESSLRHEEQMEIMKSSLNEKSASPITISKPDTIRIIEYRHSGNTTIDYLQQRIAILEAELIDLKERWTSYSKENELMGDPFTTESKQSAEGGYESQSFRRRIEPRDQETESKKLDQLHPFIVRKDNGKGLSTATLRDIEGHYQKGVGIRIGPVVEVSGGFYSEGEGQLSLGYGIASEFILSPSLSLETGLKYTRRYYELTGQPESLSLPNVDESIGLLHQADMDFWIFDIPINLKYRYPVSLKTNWVAGLGFSPIIYKKQVFEYDYLFSGSGSNYTINSTYESNEVTLYSGMLNLSLGISNKLKNAKFLETSIYYQHGLEKMGQEGVKPNFLGLRASYWFTAK